MHRRPLASFSILSQIYGPQHHNPQNHKPKPPAAIAKPEVIAIPAVAAVVAALPPLEKKKIKITVAKKTSASTSAAAPPVSPVPAPPPAPASPAPMSPRTKKIKITIKQQPKQEQPKKEKPKQEQQRVESVYTCYHFNDIAPPASFIYTPCGDYIVPPPKCCRFFIENRHCFLRSADNACIDPINKEVFGFWNCEIGKKCELLPPPPTDDHDLDQYDDNTSANLVQLDNNDDDDCIKIDALAMRKKSDANRARITGQPVAILRQKIATKHGMHSFNSLGNRR